MTEYTAATYGERIATRYDEFHTHMADPAPAVDALANLAGTGRALELSIGPGRIALPLAARRVDVHGMDASEAMVDELRAKPGGGEIPVTIGDFADFTLDQSFDLVFLVFNTLFMLPSQEDQVRCFALVARHRTDDGVFVIEGFVPDPTLFDHGQRVEGEVRSDAVMLDVVEHNAAEQRTKIFTCCFRRRASSCFRFRCATHGPRSWT
jgi:SAM-dependent methyltransferase